MQIGKYGKNPGWAVTAVVCMIYGLGFTVIDNPVWGQVGSVICGILFLSTMVVPFFVWLVRGRNSTERTRVNH